MIRGSAASLVLPSTSYGSFRFEMENSGFVLDGKDKSDVELTRVKVTAPEVPGAPASTHTCQPDVCRSLHTQYLKDKSKLAASPWDRLKTFFLVGIIGLLVLWLLVYSLAAWKGLL